MTQLLARKGGWVFEISLLLVWNGIAVRNRIGVLLRVQLGFYCLNFDL